jgi:hypothetical protein
MVREVGLLGKNSMFEQLADLLVYRFLSPDSHLGADHRI